MFASVLIRSLFILAFTLGPLTLINLWITEAIICNDGRTRGVDRTLALREYAGYRYAVLITACAFLIAATVSIAGDL